MKGKEERKKEEEKENQGEDEIKETRILENLTIDK